ncbi:hypothetical protein [Pseudoroseicyclus tamaricis]|uniref:Uncharacterized protein n=1 Tax=Pseudoroseicyclus tamaricis TaxID=2705421 RepID=A0A6B2JG88_9RHOB|nr:hypothetical protein [Pseudoroseicyclus tamaricis]NDV00143.1 hypothetical protein [Pseudoroseicyclus tamaricis]
MSASETNTEESAKRHKGPLIGIGIAVAIGAIMGIAMAVTAVMRGDDPEGADQQMNSLSGELEPAESAVEEPVGLEGTDE